MSSCSALYEVVQETPPPLPRLALVNLSRRLPRLLKLAALLCSCLPSGIQDQFKLNAPALNTQQKFLQKTVLGFYEDNRYKSGSKKVLYDVK
ncbi:hypothetical protein EJB05_32495, partial [Eragrostis curvula]